MDRINITNNPATKYEGFRRAEKVSLIKDTIGFQNLTREQKQLVTLAFFVSERAIQTTSVNAAENINYPARDNLSSGIIIAPKKYGSDLANLSQQHIYNWNCIDAIAALEKGEVNADKDDIFFDAEYTKPKDKDEVISSLNEIGYPAVVFIIYSDEHDRHFMHTCLALGPAISELDKDDKKIYFWEKIGQAYLYKISTLDEIITEYGVNSDDNQSNTHIEWGIRKLRNNKP